VLGGLPEGIFALRASSRDAAPAMLPSVQSGSQCIELVLAKGDTVEGTVVDAGDGQPIVGVEVVLVAGRSALPLAEKSVQTGDGGGFEIRGVPVTGEEMKLRARHPDYGAARVFPIEG